jgi:hypothetical protein
VPTWLEEKPKEKSSALEKSKVETSRDQGKQVWRPKDRPDGSGRSAPTCMVCFLPNEFMAPANQVVQEEASQTSMRMSNLG